VADPRRMALAAKVETVHDPAITARGAKLRHMVRVEVHFTDGTRETETVEAPRGSEQKFASEHDVVDKFRKLTRRGRSETQVEGIAELVLGCEKLPDVGVLAKAIGAAPG
jgi:aconitate decarboxylase